MAPKTYRNPNNKITNSVTWSQYVERMALKYTKPGGFSSVSNMVETAMNQLIARLEAEEKTNQEVRI
jgi:hypothetical protein